MIPEKINWPSLFKLARSCGISVTRIARETLIPRNTLYAWTKKNALGYFDYQKVAKVWNFLFGQIPLEDMLRCCEVGEL